MRKNLADINASFIMMAGFLWGTTGVVARLGFQLGVLPELLLFYRLMLTLPFYIFVLYSNDFQRDKIVKVAMIGFFLLGPFHISYYYAVERVGVSTAAILLYTHPVVATFFSWLILKEGLSKINLLFLAPSVTGAILICAEGFVSEPQGFIWGLSSSLFFALYIVFSKKLMNEGVKPIETGMGGSAWALPFVTIFCLLNGRCDFSRIMEVRVFIISFYLAFFVTVLAYYLYMLGLKKIKTSWAVIASTIEPLTATILSRIIYSEELTLMKGLGGFLILTGVVAMALKTSRLNASVKD
ncbi:MAG: EamA family transporter [Thermosphaera sp.]